MRKFILLLIVSTTPIIASNTQEMPPELPVITETPYISDFGRQVTEDFLVQFLSIFSFGFAMEDNTLVWYDWQAMLDGNTIFRDQAGNIIEDAPFLLGNCCVAVHYGLYNFDGSGIPHIIIWYSPLIFATAHQALYRFIDGEFVSVQDFHAIGANFFRDELGRIVVFYNDFYNGRHGYYYMNFDNGVTFESIITQADIHDFSAWMDFHQWTLRGGTWHPEFSVMFGTDTPITWLWLYQAEAEITASIMERLGLPQ